MSWLRIDSRFEAEFRALGLNTFDRIVEHCAGELKPERAVFVKSTRVGEATPVFFKLYSYPRPSLRFWKRASKARREFDNYAQLSELGVPVAQRVAAGEERDWMGRLKRAFVITHAVPAARNLVEFIREQPSRDVRLEICRRLTNATRTMHEANFFHHDLVWRNVLVDGSGEVVFIDCPRGGVGGMTRKRSQLRDLASLDKLASKHCNRTERLRFLLAYLGKQRMDDETRALMFRCRDYRRKRWPDDWDGK